jgi:hypothetical protein
MHPYKDFFVYCLSSLKKDIELYPTEEELWKLSGDIKNSPGNLCLHLCGNLKHNIGAVLGGNGYIRVRDMEFSRKGVSKAELLKNIDETIEMISPVLENIKEEALFPNDFYGEGMTIASVLLRIAWHLGYHCGQINYHRRLLTK